VTDLDTWSKAVESGDPGRMADAAARAARDPLRGSPDWNFTICDFLWRGIGALNADITEASGTDPRNKAGSGQMKIKGTSPHVGQLMRCTDTMVGVKMETAGIKQAYFVKRHTQSYKDGEWSSTVDLKSIWSVLDYLAVFPSWYLPIQVQPISHAVYCGPIVGVIETMIHECASRVQKGTWEAVNNIFSFSLDLRNWFATAILNDRDHGKLVRRPIYVVRTNPFLDASPLVTRLVRMETVGSVITDMTGPYGIDVSVDLWEPGDPQPDKWANLNQPTYVVRVRDRSQITGPTKTILDSAIRTAVDIAGSIFGQAVAPLIESLDTMQQVFVSPKLGVNFIEPWVMLEAPGPGRDGSVVTAEISDHTPEGWRHIIGGKSPAWLNSSINSLLAWWIDSVNIILGVVGIPSDLLSGFLNDAFFAFAQVDHFDRRAAMGPYHPQIERVWPTQASVYNVTGIANIIKALYESRGWTSAVVTFRSGEVYAYGRDVFKSSLVSLVYQARTRMLTDFVEMVMWRYAIDARDILLQIGDGKAEEPPVAKHERNLSNLLAAVNVLTLAPASS